MWNFDAYSPVYHERCRGGTTLSDGVCSENAQTGRNDVWNAEATEIETLVVKPEKAGVMLTFDVPGLEKDYAPTGFLHDDDFDDAFLGPQDRDRSICGSSSGVTGTGDRGDCELS
jgi:hypothetical protein